MVSRRDVDELTQAQRRLVAMARADLAQLARSLPGNPERARDALLDIIPLLVREYGELAATAAAEWYEQIHPGTFLARTVGTFPDAGVTKGVRYHAGHLFDSEVPEHDEDGGIIAYRVQPASPEKALAGISGALQRYIAYSTRGTIARNVQLDPLRPRFARVPSGAHTCAWCAMLASRGWVYHSRATAGEIHDFHDDCDCAIVPSFDRDQTHIEGYDPDHLYDMYEQARAKADDKSDKGTAFELRRMFPDVFTDGVHEH